MNTKDVKLATAVYALLIVLTAGFFINSFSYSYWQGYVPGAGFAPRWVSGIMLLVCIIGFFQSFREKGFSISEVLPRGVARANIIVTWLCLIFFLVLSPIAGFAITSLTMLTILFGRNMRWTKALMLSIIVSLSCYILFKTILNVPIPLNRFGF